MGIDEKHLEYACRALATKHYAGRFSKPEDDPHVLGNVESNWRIFENEATTVITAYLSQAGGGEVGAEPVADGQWRDLALQFDGHRIEALSMLRYAVHQINEYATLRDILREPLQKLRDFLSKPPLPGEAVLANRILGLSLKAPTPTGTSLDEEVRVKPLKWRAIGPIGSDVEAETPIGTYVMSFDAPTAGGATNLWMAGADVDTFSVYEKRRDAEAAAQADYEARIRSALEYHDAMPADTQTASPSTDETQGGIRICPRRDGPCPHGMGCTYWQVDMDCSTEPRS